MTNYQDRIFLQLLDNKKSTELIKKTLKSPLGLSTDIIIKLFNNQLSSLKDDLDKIKMFAAGISRAEKLTDYKLAQYYPHMFAFHQFFQSSYRARQGKVLEEVVKNILKNYANCNEVPDKVIRMREILSQSFNSTIFVGFDIDFTDYRTICNSVENVVNKVLPIWKEDSIPFISISDKTHYIRDLVFLKVIFSKL